MNETTATKMEKKTKRRSGETKEVGTNLCAVVSHDDAKQAQSGAENLHNQNLDEQ